MVGSNPQMIAVALCLAGFLCAAAAFENLASDSKPIEGLWYGSWGGGEADGVTCQPVIAELFISGDHVEVYGMRNVDRLSGTVRFDTSTRQMQITPAAGEDDQPRPKAIQYMYELKGDALTLIDSDKFSISFERVRVAQDPLGNAHVELVEATGINDAGDLLVTEFTVLQAGRAGVVYHRPENRSLKTRQATVRLVRESGWENVTVDEARKLICKSTPVVVAYRDDDRAPRHQNHTLWTETGSPLPDGEEVWRTFSRILRPGTLVFILSARENAAQP